MKLLALVLTLMMYTLSGLAQQGKGDRSPIIDFRALKSCHEIKYNQAEFAKCCRKYPQKCSNNQGNGNGGANTPIDCRLVKFADPKDYEKCCKQNPKSCSVEEVPMDCRLVRFANPDDYKKCCEKNPKSCGREVQVNCKEQKFKTAAEMRDCCKKYPATCK